MQRGIREFFGRPSKTSAPCTPALVQGQEHPAEQQQQQQQQQQQGPASDQQQHARPVVQQFSRKRRRAEASTEPQGEQQQQQQSADKPTPAAAPPAQPSPPLQLDSRPGGRALTQMHLDVGQRDFHLSRCATCGLVYCRGEPRDERLHAAFHTSATKGLRYQPWPGEREVLADGSRGRVVLVPCGADTAVARSKKLQELAGFLEEQMGLVKGWLLAPAAAASTAGDSSGGLNLYLYVSPAKRVLGCVVAESIREAFHVVPQLGPEALAQLMSHGSAAQEASPSPKQHAGSPGAAAVAAAALGPPASRPSASITFSSRGAGTAARQSEQAAGLGGGSPMTMGSEEDERSADSSPDAPGGGGSAAAAVPEAGCGSSAAAATLPGAEKCSPAGPGPGSSGPGSGSGRPVLVVDRTRRMRALCGIRLVWVSVEARRRGVASRLLDCVRSQCVRGYVVPRHELAFTQPSEEGRALIEAYASTRRFLVY